MKRSLCALALGLLVLVAAGTASATPVPPVPRSGWNVYVSWGPVCYPKKHYCTRYPIPKTKIKLFANGRLLSTHITDQKGHARLFAVNSPIAPTMYRVVAIGSYKGRKFKYSAVVPAPVPGLFVPFWIGIS